MKEEKKIKIEYWGAETTIEKIYCIECEQEMVALKDTYYTYKCPICGHEEHSRIKYPRLIIT